MAIDEFERVMKSRVSDDDDVHRAFWVYYEAWDEVELEAMFLLLWRLRPHIILADPELFALARSVLVKPAPHASELSTSASPSVKPATEQPTGGD